VRISHFFIDRPIFAAVVSLVFVILGGVTFARLPVAQYPEIAPPVINITGQFPGASAETVAETVSAPIEQQVNGAEGMLYISSNSTADGRFAIAVTFDIGTNLDIAQVQVQNRVSAALPRLPQQVQQIGVTVVKSSPDILLAVNLYSSDKSRDALFMSNYANIQIKDLLTRVDGVGSITIFGARDYAMQIWLDPNRLQSLNLTALDVTAALQGQNIQVASGVLNAPPVPNQLAFQVAVRTLGRLSDPAEFANIVIKQTPNAIGYVELIYAAQNKVPYGSVKNSSGSFVKADLASVTEAAAGAVKTMPDDFRVSITNSAGKNAYPISSFTWLLIPEKFKDSAKRDALKKFLTWAITDGQDFVEALSYAKLPKEVVEKELKAVGKIQ